MTREPTREMLDAGFAQVLSMSKRKLVLCDESLRELWHAMFDAAPPAPGILAEHADAARYRWLRDSCRSEHDADIAAGIGWQSHANGTLDAWIDAVRATKGKP